MIESVDDLKSVGLLLQKRPDLLAGESLSDENERALRSLLEDERFSGLEQSPVSDERAVEAAGEYVQDYGLQELSATRDKVLAIDLATIGLVTAVWLLIQTEIEFKYKSGGEYEFKLKKKAGPEKALLTLVSFLKDKLLGG